MKKMHGIGALVVCASLFISGPMGICAFALPVEAPTDSLYTNEYERLADDVLEYDELGDRIRYYYGPIREAYALVNSTLTGDLANVASLMHETAVELEDDADEMQELIDNNDLTTLEAITDTTVDILTNRATAAAYRSGARSIYRTITYSTRDSSSTMKTLQRTVNQMLYQMEMTMNGYAQVAENRAVVAKALEISEEAKAMRESMRSQGMAVSADILSAISGLASSQATLDALDVSAESIKKTLCQYMGYSDPESVTFGEIPDPDLDFLETMDLEADREKAVNNNYELITLRSGTTGNLDEIQETLTKTTTQTRVKHTQVDYNEAVVRSDFESLYDAVFEEKASYDSAGTEYEAAKLNWEAARIQWETGSLSKLEFMQQELVFLQAQAAYRTSALSLQQAIRNYSWAMQGVSVSA